MKIPRFAEFDVKEGPGFCDTNTEIFVNKKKWGELSIRLKEVKDFKLNFDEYLYVDKLRWGLRSLPISLWEEADFEFMLLDHGLKNKKRGDLFYFLSLFLPSEIVVNMDIVFGLDEDILKLIEKVGPPAFSIAPVQEKICEWLRDESTARLNKISESLIKWFHKKEPQGVRIKEGAPEKIILKQIGPKFIKSMKKIIGSTLKSAKELYQGGSIDSNELLEQAYLYYIASLEKQLNQDPASIEIKEILDMHKSKSAYKKRGYTSYLSKTITESPDLYQEFETFLNSKFVTKHSFHYRPHELAEIIIAKRLKVSRYTIRSFISR
ncbi:hypothetical protein ACFLRX_00620 [Acidobacteriota bacterium]